ncbi:transposase [Spirosoma foliorum]|uniref:Transposase n=1 Tax=Spirosoma foliorum TaxID=2710596 RepID=A0A7G5GYV0_9BACT|nr:transposase [Spirosoma foliorum]QMW04042.1 transposase [Spirosoma foliorum]
MDIRYFIGVDVSKATLDWAVFDGKTTVLQLQSANSPAAIRTTVKVSKALPYFTSAESVCCLEHTGIYCAHLLSSLYKLKLPIWLESSLQIKKAGGLQRGKSDTIDAVRIAEYAFRFRDKMGLWQPPRPILQKLATLSALRQRHLRVRQHLQQPIAEQQGFVEKSRQKQLAKNCQASLKAINADLASAEKQINTLIQRDERLKELFGWITSVPGVGDALAAEVLVATNEFKAINDPKKLASHAGVAPFEYRSGSSVRGKTRVSQHARLRLKSVFHLGAMSVIQMKGELRDYYRRKVGDGKNKMLVLNAVRNKLLHRVCSVIHRQQKYDKNYAPTLA